MEGVGFIDAKYNIYDGAHVGTNCTDINKAQFSYNNGVFLLGAAMMYNYVSWKTFKMATREIADPLPDRRIREVEDQG